MDSEEQLLAVLSHELAHYYRSHALYAFSGKNSPYNYFYEQSEVPLGGKPRAMHGILANSLQTQKLSQSYSQK